MRSLFVALLFFVTSASQANSLTDTWWVPTEAGWGITVVQEKSQLQLAMFVYDNQHQPRWYSALLEPEAGFKPVRYFGTLQETQGTPFAQPWEPSDVVNRPVGRVTFIAHGDGRAVLDYVVDGRRIIKDVVRLTTQQDTLVGLHFATMLPSYEGCEPGFSGLSAFEHGTLQIDRCEQGACSMDPLPDGTPSPIAMSFSDGNRSICSIEGRFIRYGRSGGVRGDYVCSDGGHGNIEMRDIEFSSVGFSARFSADHPRCEVFKGILSGVNAAAR